jgi:PTS system fructose-specific IIC component
MAAVMAGGMVPPLGIGLATLVFKKKFSDDQREAGKAALVLGASFITEGAIPFAAADPARVLPSIMVGGAIAGAVSMALGCTLAVPHGGIFVLFAVENILGYVIAIVAGSVATAALLGVLKKNVD